MTTYRDLERQADYAALARRLQELRGVHQRDRLEAAAADEAEALEAEGGR